MAKFNLDYYSGEDAYSDGDIEERILDIVKNDIDVEKMDADEMSYPILYHLSHVRQNILLWYPFEKGCRILEVGSGCGAITELLCQRAENVTSVELSKRRATINYERNKKYDNLEIIVGNLNDVAVEEKYDYIILNGVFEYAASFTEGDTPYETFLSSIAERLKSTGTILIAIENRLGAKYFSGAPEDHLNLYFTGINEYPNINTVRTFTRTEMKSICDNVGLVCDKFYYPYPDYKFSYEIFTDKTINSTMYGTEMFQFDETRLDLIREDKLNQTLAKEKVADVFANSFLVEICKNPKVRENEIQYVKINSDRAEEFRLYTTIWNGREQFVGKYPIGKKAEPHVLKMQDNAKKVGNAVWHNLEGTVGKNKEIIYPMLKEATLDEIAAGYVQENRTDKIVELLQDVHHLFFADAVSCDTYNTPEFQQVFGATECQEPLKCVKNANIDIILNNIFFVEGEYVLIDTEWIFDFPIPSEYIMWRVVNELFHNHQRLYEIMDYSRLLEKFGITEELEEIFRQWEMHFAYEYVKGHGLKRYAKPLLKMPEVKTQKKYLSKLYVDIGSGYHEENMVPSKIEYREGRFKQVFQLPEEEIRCMRWDPIKRPCVCGNISITANGKPMKMKPMNAAYTLEEKDVFLVKNPYYGIGGSIPSNTEVVIEGDIRFLDENGLMEMAEPLWKKEESLWIKLKRQLNTIFRGY